MNVISTNTEGMSTQGASDLAKELGWDGSFEHETTIDQDIEDYISQPLVSIDGSGWVVVKSVHNYSYAPMIELEDGTEWYFFETHEEAGQQARKYWEEMAQDDPREFTCIVGEKTLVAWALGVRSLDDWLDLWLDTPEENWASYDGREWEPVAANDIFADELGFNSCDYVVCYRRN